MRAVALPRHVVVALSAWGSRVVSAGSQLLVIRLALPILGETDFARFSILTGLLVWFMLVEFGLGPSVQNLLAEFRAEGRVAGVVLRAASVLALVVMTVATAILWAVAAPAQSFLFRQLGPSSVADAHVLGVVGTLLIATTIANISTRVFYGDMRGDLANGYTAIGYLASLAAVFALTRHMPATGHLLWLLVAWTAPRAAVCALACVHVAIRFDAWSAPSDGELVRRLWSASWRFGGFAILSAFVLGMDYLVMSQTLTSAEIVEYTVASKVLTLAIFLYSSLRDAAWPVATYALARGETAPVRRLTRQLVVTGVVLVAAGTAAFAWLTVPVTSLLAGGSASPARAGVIFSIGGYYLLRVWSDTFAMVLQSRGRLRVFWLYVPVQALVSAAAQYWLSLRYGVYGIIAGLSLSFLVTAVWILPVAYERLLGESGARPPVPA